MYKRELAVRCGICNIDGTRGQAEADIWRFLTKNGESAPVWICTLIDEDAHPEKSGKMSRYIASTLKKMSQENQVHPRKLLR